MSIAFIILLAVSLSMDAFSFAISIGIYNKDITVLSTLRLAITIGIFHLIMPLIGFILLNIFDHTIKIRHNFLSGIIFLFLAFEMIKNFNNDETTKELTIKNILSLAFGVSIDSFMIGFTFPYKVNTVIISALFFSVFSCIFTLLGLYSGKKISKVTGTFSKALGILIMLILSVFSFVKS